MSSRRRITIALLGLILLAVVGWLVKDLSGHGPTPAATSTPSTSALSTSALPASTTSTAGLSASGLPVRAMSTLPVQVGQTYRLVRTGGPFPYPTHDGVVFDNRERRLPAAQPGYYHEYTVPTPGSADRGSRRLITGARHELYYTDDHYNSFVVVNPNA